MFCYLYRILQQRLRVIKRIVFPVSQKRRKSMVQCVSVSVCVSHSNVWSEARSVNQWSRHGSAKTCSVMIGHNSQAKTEDIARIGTILIGQRHNIIHEMMIHEKAVTKNAYWNSFTGQDSRRIGEEFPKTLQALQIHGHTSNEHHKTYF